MIASGLGDDASRYFKEFVKKIPIPEKAQIGEEQIKILTSLVNTILIDKKQGVNADVSELESEINVILYGFYKLNTREVSFLNNL